MIPQVTMDALVRGYADLDRRVHDAFQAMVDVFMQPLPLPHNHRHIMRKKIRRCYR
jgi:hypothetical protein